MRHVTAEWAKAWAFLRRDWLIHSSSGISTAVRLGYVLFTSASFFYIGRLVAPQHAESLRPYGGAYFPFVVLGLLCSRYLTMSLSGFSEALRDEQLQGTFEVLLTTPTSLFTILVGGALWVFLWATIEAGMYLAVGALLFGLDLSRMNLLATVVVLSVTVFALSGVGALSAGGILLFREGDPVRWMLDGLMRLIGGVYFPVVLLPGWLQHLAAWFPLTHGLEGFRRAALAGTPLRDMWPACVWLVLFALVSWAVAAAALSWTIRRLREHGALNFR